MIYIIRGQKVMLDADLAKIYGYTTKAFNQQVKNNIEKFEEDFMFLLTDQEVKELSRSKITTTIMEVQDRTVYKQLIDALITNTALRIT